MGVKERLRRIDDVYVAWERSPRGRVVMAVVGLVAVVAYVAAKVIGGASPVGAVVGTALTLGFGYWIYQRVRNRAGGAGQTLDLQGRRRLARFTAAMSALILGLAVLFLGLGAWALGALLAIMALLGCVPLLVVRRESQRQY